MDFVEGLGDTSFLQDVLIDGIGRAEVFGGRVRITLYRILEVPGGRLAAFPVIPVVWTLEGWYANRKAHAMMRALIDAGGAPIAPEPGSPLRH